jgi:KaiC/GvpD/RAD55 family RecA-like ATPase
MIDERIVLAAGLYSRREYEALSPYLVPGDMSALGDLLWGLLGQYYARDPAALKASPALLQAAIATDHPQVESTAADLLRQLDPDVGTLNAAREVLALKARSAGDALMLALSAHGTDAGKVLPLVEEYQRLVSATSLMDVGAGALLEADLASLISKTEEPGARTKLLPKALNDYLRGGVLPGHCVIVFGRVNVGKSTIAIHNAAGFLRQGKRVLYIENEDLLEDTLIRMGCRLVGCDRDWAAKNPEEFKATAEKRGFGNFLLPDPAPMTVAEIDSLIGKYEPDVCIVNQARNLVQGSKDPVTQLDNIAKQLRALGKRRRVIMFLVTAAKEGEVTGSGEVKDRAVLEMHDCYSSRTGFPAAADVMIGFGADKGMKERNMVCLSLCKNKLGTHPKTGKAEAVLHARVDFARGLISDITQ